jgi:geranylgeranyl pyrophosphate synthase
MVTGQTVDLSDNIAGRDGFDTMRNLKTSALIRLALRLGAILAGAAARQLTALSRFATLIGEAYQISDDVLDLVEDAALAGRTRCATLAIERGAHEAESQVALLVTRAKDVLVAEFGRPRPSYLLCEMADYIAGREI